MSLAKIVVIVIALGSLFFLYFKSKNKQEDNVPNLIISTGLGIISNSFSGTIEMLLHCVTGQNIQTVDFGQLIVGFIVLTVGIFTLHSIHKKIYILNMPGETKHEICIPSRLKQLKLIDYQVKEIELDTFWLQNNLPDKLPAITPENIDLLYEQIQDTITRFSAKDGEKCFTGMSPIPFEILAGKCYTGEKVSRYFEYISRKEMYKELDKKAINFPDLSIPALEKDEATDVLVVFSTTTKIDEQALEQFTNYPTYRIELDSCHDNAITKLEQLRKYIEDISKILEEISEKVSKLERIHLVCSTQSCVAFALGEELRHKQNRIATVISYHYISSSPIKYPFGIIVNGTNCGQLYEQNS